MKWPLVASSFRSLRQSTIRKHELMQRKLQTFSEQDGYIFLRQLGIDQVREFRNTWKLNPRTAAKSLERLRSFFKFCVDSEWMDKNPANAIKSAKVEDADVLPFNESEVKKILKACDTFNGNSDRIKALTELMLRSGLRIGDAATISREKFVRGRRRLEAGTSDSQDRRAGVHPLTKTSCRDDSTSAR